MLYNNQTRLKKYLPLLFYLLLLLVVAVVSNTDYQHLIIAGCLLLLPLLDVFWKLSSAIPVKLKMSRWIVLLLLILLLIMFNPTPDTLVAFALSTLVFAAFPEEWFFRAYLLVKLGSSAKANILSSLAFTSLHVLSHGNAMALLVFVPSLFFGWVYQKTNDLVTVVLLHTLFNVVYVGYLYTYVKQFYE